MRFSTDFLNCMDEEQIKKYQEKLLRRQVSYCYNNSEYYRKKFREVGANPNDINSLEDLRKLPVMMTKQEERESQKESLDRLGHPFGMHLCCKLEDLELTATTSGTTGTPTFTYTFTKEDLYREQAKNWAHMLDYGGVKPGDRVLFCYALGVYATTMILPGIRSHGALPIDVDIRGGSEMILKFAELTKPTAAYMTPSLAEYLIDKTPKAIGKSVAELGIRKLFLTGEPAMNIPEVKAKTEKAYNCRAYDYMAQGAGSFGMSCDSDEYYGMHCFAPDYNLFQDDIVDPETKEPIEVKEGAVGEAVHTSLNRQAVPYLRYAYGDIVEVYTSECPNCGFKGKRVKVVGRSDDLLIIKGANVYPSGIKAVIKEFVPRTTGNMRIVLEEKPPRVVPPLKIKVEYGQDVAENQLPEIEKQIKHEMHTRLRFTPEIIWQEPGSLETPLGKTPMFESKYKK